MKKVKKMQKKTKEKGETGVVKYERAQRHIIRAIAEKSNPKTPQPEARRSGGEEKQPQSCRGESLAAASPRSARPGARTTRMYAPDSPSPPMTTLNLVFSLGVYCRRPECLICSCCCCAGFRGEAGDAARRDGEPDDLALHHPRQARGKRP